MKRVECLIIGSGIAGLTFALKVAKRHPDWTLLIVTKSKVMECNTRYAQGGIAAVWNKLSDNFEKHFEDTMQAGQYLSNPDVVRLVIESAPKRVAELIQWGVIFDSEDDGKLQLGLEGGHSANRILHHKDITGLEIEKKLWQAIKKRHNVTVLKHIMALDILKVDKKVCGVQVYDRKKCKSFDVLAKLTVLASGGIGQLFANTTNPEIATADGLAMAIRAGAVVRNLQHVQFHPTMLYKADKSVSILISEALRGFVAYLVNHAGERFMFKYHKQGELATRDIVSEALFIEMEKEGTPYQFIDCRHLGSDQLEARFPFVIESCRQNGINPVSELIPVVPAAHYHCGGIAVDVFGRTSLKGLTALGECAETGLHGANRLASNSLLEALVFAHQAALKATEIINHTALEYPVVTTECVLGITNDLALIVKLKNQLQGVMDRYFKIRHSSHQLTLVKNVIEEIEITLSNFNTINNTIELQELKNMVLVAKQIILSAIADNFKTSENKHRY